MEEKITGTPPQAASPMAEAPASSRRRGGGQKRKASAIGSGNTSTPSTSSSKRQAREKTPALPFPPIHNGPLTRARQQPNNSASTAVAPLSSGAKSKLLGVMLNEAGGGEMAKADELNEVAKEDWQALEAKIEAEYEALTSRDSNVHVVPNHAGWYSWTKIHPLEEKTLPSFFNGKSESRTPEMYMEIRNWIMKRFHSNPNTPIELKDLSEISVGELDARQEVMEFLDYWGLINYHPFPKADLTTVSFDAHKAAKADSLMESLFLFESDQSCVPIVPRKSVATPSMSSRLFPESTIVEELVKSEEPSVEYHCNSCSADCSRKRYHCQKQADFDLCIECFNNGKFGSDMSPSDFIIMEPAEAGGASSGNWTDQETLLLLEALELFKDNWNEIAEHVATKTKAQCILHFVQMPIEDTFLDSCGEIDHISKGNSDAVSIINDASAPKDGPEATESKDKANDNERSSSPIESLKPEEVNGSTVEEVSENFAMKALAEAFEIFGSLPSPGERLSFAEAGNPVMTLAAFLVRLLEPNVATASARSSLKSISGNSSGDQLALRHCFCLEDPPDEKNPANAERMATEMVEQETPKSEQQNTEKQENSCPVADAVHGSNDDDNQNNKDSVMEEERPLASPSLATVDEPSSAKESNETTHEESEPTLVNEAENQDLAKEPPVPNTAEKSDVLTMEVEVPPGFEKEPDDVGPLGEPSKLSESPKDMDMMPIVEIKDHLEPTTSNSVAEHEANIEVIQDANKEAKDIINEEKCASETKNYPAADKIKSAAITALSAAAVKAKFLASQEEQQVHRLVTLLIEKQLHKLETKLAFFNDMENLVMRVREQMERTKQRLFHERAQIIATRLGISASRPMPQSLPVNRVAMAFANSASRPMIGSSMQPSNKDHFSSVGTK